MANALLEKALNKISLPRVIIAFMDGVESENGMCSNGTAAKI